jgi:predicted Rdx family selenoprotein
LWIADSRPNLPRDFIKPERDLLFACRETLETRRDFSAATRQTSASARNFIKPERDLLFACR